VHLFDIRKEPSECRIWVEMFGVCQKKFSRKVFCPGGKKEQPE